MFLMPFIGTILKIEFILFYLFLACENNLFLLLIYPEELSVKHLRRICGIF
jgi:hypothetical protein